MPPPLRTTEIWQGMIDALRGNFALLFAVAAPFTLLVDMVLSLFGPEPPRRPIDFTPDKALWLLLLPALIGAVAQLAMTRLLVVPRELPRTALGTALAAWPAYVAALLLSALPTAFAFAALVLPGVWVLARLFVLVPVMAIERTGPVEALRRSWALTEGQAGAIMAFLALAVLFTLGAGLIAGGVAGAFASVLTLAGLKPVGSFVAALVPALVGTVFAMANAAAAAFLYRRLA